MNLDAERERLRDHLVRSAEEIRSAEHAGWGNVMDWAITLIDAQASALAEMQGRIAEVESALTKAAFMIEGDFCSHTDPHGPDNPQCYADFCYRAIRALGKGT